MKNGAELIEDLVRRAREVKEDVESEGKIFKPSHLIDRLEDITDVGMAMGLSALIKEDTKQTK